MTVVIQPVKMALSMKVVLVSVVAVLVVAGAIVGIVFAVKASEDDDNGGRKCEGIPAITNLAAAGENGNMVLTWDVEDTTKYCSLDYEVTYFIGEEKIESIFTDDPTYTFMNVEPCALIRVIVVPQSAEGSSGEPAERTYEADLGEVESLVVNFDGEKLIFSWTVPNEYKYCKYGITIDNDVLAFDLEGREYSHDIDAIDLVSCTENTYRAFTVGQGLSIGTQVEYKYTIGVITAVGNVKTIENADDTLTVSWDAPENIDSCFTDERDNSLTYTVLYINGAKEEPCTTVTETSVTCPFEADDCTGYNIKITTNAGDHEGRPHTEKRIARVGPAEITDVYEDDNKLIVKWDATENLAACPGIKYELKYSEGVIEQEVQVDGDTFPFELKSDICTTVKISVIPHMRDSYGEESSTEYYVVGGLIVTGITITEKDGNLEVDWKAPANAGACTELTYTATYTDKAGSVDVTDILVVPHEFDLTTSPCEKVTISVTPINGDVTGKLASEEYYISIPPVTDVTISDDRIKLKASWTPPANSDKCELTYSATYTDKDGSLIKETDPSTDLSFEFDLMSSPCEKLTITVIPHHTNSDVSGTAAPEEYYVSIPPVTDITIGDDGIWIYASWTAPADTDACELTYTASYLDKDGELIVEPGIELPSDFSLALSYSPCEKVMISVTPFNGEVSGPEASEYYYVSIQPVNGLTITDDGTLLKASWTAPHNIGVCTPITYTATYIDKDNSLVEQSDIELPSDFESTLHFSSCEKVTISVTPINDESTGWVASKVYYVKIRDVRDITIDLVDGERKIVSTWVEPEVIEACSTLSYDVTYLEDGVEKGTVIVKPPDTLEATFEIENQCARLTVSVFPRNIQSAGILKASNELNQIGEVGEIGIVQTPGAQEIITTWDVPVNILYCPDLSYDVKYFENDIEVATNPFPNPPAKFNIKSECAQVKVSVLPKSPTSEGIWKDSITIGTDSCPGPAVLHV